MISDIISGGTLLGFLGILIKLLVDWIRTRRAGRAAEDVAEGSVQPTLAQKNLSVLDSQIVLLEKANSKERASYERRIVALERDVTRLTTERDDLQRSLTSIRGQMDELQRRFDSLKQQMDALPRSRGGRP